MRYEQEALPQITRARQEAAGFLDALMGDLENWFARRQAGCKPFTEEVLGWKSTGLIVRDRLTFSGNEGRHAVFIQEAFNRHLFTEEDLQRVAEQVRVDYLSQLRAIENRLLVDLRLDVDDAGWQAGGAACTHSPAVNWMDLTANIGPAAGKELGLQAAQSAAGWVAGELAVRLTSIVIERLGVSAAVIGAGAGSSWTTAGISLAAAVAIDYVAGKVIQAVHDPHGEVQRHTEELVGQTARIMIEGDKHRPGLRQKWQTLTDQWTEQLRARIEGLMTDRHG